MKINIYILFSSILVLSCLGHKPDTGSPEFVGRPPQNAYTGLVRLEDGEIRHYGKDLYIRSRNKGLTWDTIAVTDGNLYGKKSPVNGEYIRVYAGEKDKVYSARSIGGIDGEWIKELIDTNGAIMIKPVVFIKNGKRAIAGFHTKYRNGCGTY